MMVMGSGSGSDSDSKSNGWSRARGLVVKTLVLIGYAILVKRLTRSTTRRDHARLVSQSLSGEKFSKDQASRDPDNFFNIRWLSRPAAEMVDGSKAFRRTPQKPFRQRFYMVKPCPKELKCDIEVGTYAIRDAKEYRNFRDRPKGQRPLPEENGASHCTSDLTILKNDEVHTWDRGYNDDGNQVWGVKEGPYEFKPTPSSNAGDLFSPLIFHPAQVEKRIEGSVVLKE